MAPKTRVIIDTDVGECGDDIIAILVALAAPAEDVEILLLSVVWGNVNVDKGLRNIITVFYIAQLEMQWREAQGIPVGFQSLCAYKPIVAVGSPNALGEKTVLKTDGFHGPDGVGNFHTSHAHMSPPGPWRSLFQQGVPVPENSPSWYKYFTPSHLPAHKEILRVLKSEPAGTVTVCSIGPMTNIALAAAEDPEVFLRTKELLVMGGAVDVPGNITPLAEANTWNDALACARVFALTSADPASTMPLQTTPEIPVAPYPEKLSSKLLLKLFPLDITLGHYVDYTRFAKAIKPQIEAGSPLAVFVDTILGGIFRKVCSQYGGNASPKLALHDGLTIWYALSPRDPSWEWAALDIRVETTGQWTHGMHVTDRRGKVRADGVNETEIAGDHLGWLSSTRGNRINVVARDPLPEAYHYLILEQLFAGQEASI
ncbi:hypothetical protein PFICI_07877 [Pestalotiopsis fici W106-1]|uniref:Inosine/uridine-preferring nucleoside hydrolase domain-containing protein n=1 Tax=Pestalotiopsis fici (strain W106-1 / CGMCC3.15140) TaxID=1229662 RepID=W3X2I2_PESFW|nr:uncharacterized protein PFICI_07877 [Pestalotiopsis fici W106-1]ETS80348.1 hypothetical protein PFICI_07877 [Pestalotiopsis fici W106-1]